MYTSAFDGARRLYDSGRPMEMKLFCGHCPLGDDRPVVGRLSFFADPATGSSDACIRVTEICEDLESGSDNTAAVIVLGSDTFDASQQAISYPVLFLPELSPVYHGKIALLDPTRGLLFISPDLMTLNRYSQRLGFLSKKSDIAPVFLPDGRRLRFCTFLPAESEGAEGGLLEAPPSRSEDGIYDYYRDTAEGAVGLPLTVILELSWGEELLRMQLRGLFRSAVYGNFSCLIRGVLTDADLLRFLQCSHHCFCELESEGREFNGYIKKGLLVDAPLLLHTPIVTDGLDLLCLDLGALTHRLTAQNARQDAPLLSAMEKAVVELLQRNGALSLSVIAEDSPTVLSLLPRLLPLGITELFAPSHLSGSIQSSLNATSTQRQTEELSQKKFSKK